MKIFESLNIPERFLNPVLTIGNYDGLHAGHKRIIEKVKERARAISGTPMLMTFHPHPVSVLRPGKSIGLITPMPIKKRLIAESGIDVLIIVPFNEDFRLITPDAFVEEILIERLGIQGLVVGYDFKFGKEGRGDTQLLGRYAEEMGFFFEVVDAIKIDGEKVGSNRIRKMIMEGEIGKVNRFLQRPYSVAGRIIRGEGRGRIIGFPTINLDTQYELIPKRGVYVSEAEVDGRKLPSVTNVGYNPTFEGRALSIETYILDHEADLYGKEITLYFHERIRDEVKFDSIDELKKGIRADVEKARNYFHYGVL